jgi:glycosyltransferase involved in cell wall biosynthesis
VLNDFRGLDPVIESLELLVDSGLEVELIVAGEGPHRLSLEAKARLIGVSDRVQFIGWIDAEDVPAFLAAGDIGLVPHDVNSFTNTTVPNKLFDCMSVGIPVATSNMDPVARIVEDVGCGRVFRPDSSPPCVAATLRSMLTDDNLAEMGRRGRAAVLEEYKWQREAGRIRRTLDSLV